MEILRRTDDIEELVDKAHAIFNGTSIHEVIDLDQQAARAFLMKAYSNPDTTLIDKYLDVVAKLR
ncbi:hypothetical protein FCL47_12960 [Desulfopila sp. IMCC35006]|uniref:hypothetical protein n=1 Tax=Desulfopila sp. IMCC35006 TaxID=2569542 RepID=UPI0010AD0D28|nr:hypothetical protein [Desulfopila sp. IMCC35006]TKB25989.1 hypothetical protein FCL47_12960 [Desulfopila sp. IMCC35006]